VISVSVSATEAGRAMKLRSADIDELITLIGLRDSINTAYYDSSVGRYDGIYSPWRKTAGAAQH